jgi:hypothetical protein
MINMISFAQIEKIEKQKTSPAESDEAKEGKAMDFAALIAVPVESANISAVQNNEFSEKNTDADSSKTNQKVCSPAVPLTAAEISLRQNPDQQFPGQDTQKSVNEAIGKNINFKSLLNLQYDGQSTESFHATEKVFSEEAKDLIKTYLESGRAEILDNTANKASTDNLQIDFSGAANVARETEGKSAGLLPQLFRKISNVFRSDEMDKPKSFDSSSDFISESEVFEKIESISQIETHLSENGSALNLNQPEIGTAKNKKQFASAESLSALSFDKILSQEPQGQKLLENSQPVNPQFEKVFEQVEPKILQLLTLKNIENEKKVIKMRLYPAELGTLEIKLEKNASGTLNIHFETVTDAAQQIISEGIEQLRDALKNSGWLVERLEVSCTPFSQTANSNRENDSRQFEPIENQLKTQSVSDNSSDGTDDAKTNLSNRLLSVRA